VTNNQKRSWEFLSLSLVLGILASVGTLVFFAWLTDEVLDGETRQFDDATRIAVHQFASPVLTKTMRGISFIGSTLFLATATVLMFVWFMKRKWRREAWLFAITMLGAAILNTTLKLTFRRPRPVPFFDLLAPESFSFPSGHSLASFCFFGALATILTARIRNRRINFFTWTIAAIMVFLIGLSRIYLGVHYTTDVIAGFAAAFIWIAVIRFVEMQLARRRRKRQQKTSTDSTDSAD
jgi:membrane-associated phospholipid phosphatase